MRHPSETPFQAPSFARAPALSARYSPLLPTKPSGTPPPGASVKQRPGHPSSRHGRALHMPPRAITCKHEPLKKCTCCGSSSLTLAPKLHLGCAGRSTTNNTPRPRTAALPVANVQAPRSALPVRQVDSAKSHPRPRLFSGGESHRVQHSCKYLPLSLRSTARSPRCHAPPLGYPPCRGSHGSLTAARGPPAAPLAASAA